MISLALRFGTGKTESRERIAKAKENRKNAGTSSPVPDEAPVEEVAPVQAEEAAPEKPTVGDVK